MALTVKKALLWRKELDNCPGALAKTLQPLVEVGNNLSIVMGYVYPHNAKKAAVEVYPVLGKAAKVAKQIGLKPATKIACLSVEGDDKLGLGEKISQALATNNINISFLVVQTTGKKWLGVFGFENEKQANKASTVIKQATKKKNKSSVARKK
jgi:predicted amino acid-binding ACT domain protein